MYGEVSIKVDLGYSTIVAGVGIEVDSSEFGRLSTRRALS